MKLRIERQKFLKSWQLASRVNNGFLRIAGNVLEATDMKSSTKCVADGVDVLEDGVAVVPVNMLGSLLKKSESEELILDVNASRGLLKGTGNSTRFTIQPADSYPNFPSSDCAELICTVKGSELARVIAEGNVAAAAPTDFPRYLGTCLMKADSGILTVVSTDGKRLSVSETSNIAFDNTGEMILTSSATKELGKTLAQNYADNDVKILTDGVITWFQVENMEFAIVRVEANFPAYIRILNDEVYTRLKINRSELISALERISIISRSTTANLVAMQLIPEQEKVKLFSRAPEVGMTSETLLGEITENPLQCGFNVNFLLDGLRAITTDQVEMVFSGADTQMRIKSDNFLYMVMPARLSNLDLMTDEETEDLQEW